MDLVIREFKNALVNFINTTTLPIEVKNMVVADISRQLQEEANKEIYKQLAERESQTQEENNDNVSE